jgi:hypothetical protein
MNVTSVNWQAMTRILTSVPDALTSTYTPHQKIMWKPHFHVVSVMCVVERSNLWSV